MYLKKLQTFITLIKLLAGIPVLKFRPRSRAGLVVDRKLSKAGFPLGEFVRANKQKVNLIGW